MRNEKFFVPLTLSKALPLDIKNKKTFFCFVLFSLIRTFAAVMKRMMIAAIGLMLTVMVTARPDKDPRCVRMMDVPMEGEIDTLRQVLKAAGFTEWGGSEDGEDVYFRGQYYGIRAKLMVSLQPLTTLVQSAYVTIGPYSGKSLLERNLKYFKYKLEQDYGELTRRDDAYYYMGDFGSVKLSVVDNGDGSRDIRVLYFQTIPFYKDAVCRGLHGNVQEIVTDNPLAEEPVERFLENGQIDDPELTSRHYDRYGYLLWAETQEKEGRSTVEYEYDDRYRLKRRTLTNVAAGVSYVNDYIYNDNDELVAENQKIYDSNGQCVMTLNMRNKFMERDTNGNWTVNSLSLTYWEKDSTSKQSTALQRRNISYWE